MNINSMITEFTETYSREAMDYIDEMKNNIARTRLEQTIKLTDTAGNCNRFAKWIGGYQKFCIEQTERGDTVSFDNLGSEFDKVMADGTIIHEKAYQYPEIPTFVTGYLEGITAVKESAENAKADMMEHGVDQEVVGGIETLVEKFTDKLYEAFTPGMDILLTASGYKTHRTLRHLDPVEEKKKSPVFV